MDQYSQQELEQAITLLETQPIYATLHQVEQLVTNPLWKMRVRPQPVTLWDSTPMTYDAAWKMERILRCAGYNVHRYDGLPTDVVYDAEDLDAYAEALAMDTAQCDAKEQQQVQHVLFMLKTWLKHANKANRAPLPTLKKRSTKRVPVIKPETDPWKAAKRLARSRQLNWPVDLTTCVYVTHQGVLAVGDDTLMWAYGAPSKRPGYVYHMATGALVDDADAIVKMRALMDLHAQQRSPVYESSGFTSQWVYESALFISAVAPYGVWQTGDDGLTLTASVLEVADVQVGPVGEYSLPYWESTLNMKELAIVARLLPLFDCTVYHFSDGSLGVAGGNINAICLPKLEEM